MSLKSKTSSSDPLTGILPGRVPKEVDSSEDDEDFDVRSNNNNNRRQNNVPFPVNGVVSPKVSKLNSFFARIEVRVKEGINGFLYQILLIVHI